MAWLVCRQCHGLAVEMKRRRVGAAGLRRVAVAHSLPP